MGKLVNGPSNILSFDDSSTSVKSRLRLSKLGAPPPCYFK